jgi:uncharacterized protein
VEWNKGSDGDNSGNIEASRKESKVWGFWPTIGFSAVIFLVFFFVQTLIAFIFGLAYAMDSMPTDPEAIAEMAEALTTNGLLLSLATIFSGIAGVAAILAFIKLKKNTDIKEYLGLNSLSVRAVILMILISCLLLVVFAAASSLINPEADSQFTLEAYKSSVWPVLFWIAVVIFAPLFEELFFRGFLFTGLINSSLGPAGTIAITSVLWTILHIQYDIFGMATILVLGIIFGTIRYVTKSIWSTLILHATWNLLQLIMLSLAISGVIQ